MAEVVGGKVIEAVANETVDSVWRQIEYVWNYKSNIRDLENQLKKVKAERKSMKRRLAEAARKGENVEDRALNWCENADAAIRVAADLLAQHSAANKSCFLGYCPNLMIYHQFSRKTMKETIPALLSVLQDMSSVSRISYLRDVQQIEYNPNCETLGSRMAIMEEILAALNSSDVNLIGIFGCSGVGKSTLVEQLVARVKKNIFKVVTEAKVPHPMDLRTIQQEIAGWLGLDLNSGHSTKARGFQLRKRLEQEEKVLIILDNVWRRIPLEEIGIPETHKGCKILMTSRQLDVLEEMGVQENFQLTVLKKDEAWQLFETKIGGFRDPRIQPIAREVAKRCLGLPVLIVEVATSLRSKELDHWEDALKDLDNMDDKSILVGPWGGNGGTAWDDGIYTGVREITIYCGYCIDSIQVVYDKNGRPVPSEKRGGDGGTKMKPIILKFPEEFLVSAKGYYDPIDGGSTVIRSITFKSNKNNKFGPYGFKEGIPFTLSTDGASIVGFMGRSGCFLDAIGFRLSRSQSTEPLQKVRQRLQRLDSSVTKSPTLLRTLKRVIDDE